MSISLRKDADKKIAKLVSKKDAQNILKSVNDAVANFIPDKYVASMQDLIVKVAQIISEVSDSGKLDKDNYPNAVKYLCKDVLKDKGLSKDFEALVINPAVSKGKEDEVNEEAVAESIYKYHRLIGELVTYYDIHALEGLVIREVIGSAIKAKKPKKQEKTTEAEKPKKQEKNMETEKPKKQEKTAEVEQPKKQEKKPEAPQPKKQEEPKAKQVADKKQEPVKVKETVVTSTATVKKTSSSGDKAKAVYVDEAVGVLTVELTRGDGWYEVGGLSKKDFFQCMIKVGFEGNGKYDLKNAQIEVTAFKVDGHELQEAVKNSVIVVKPGESELDIEMEKSGMKKFLKEVGGDNINRLPTQVSLSITAMVKSGVKTKKLPCDVTCTF